jgi:prepilin-type N-terminal cleavage/methylation domain-containing protein
MPKYKFGNKVKGFTLVELLVVISIIGLLAGLIAISIGSSRNRARDARRMSDFRQIPAAQEWKMGDDQSYVVSDQVVGSIPAVVNSANHRYLIELVDPLNSNDYRYVWVKNNEPCGAVDAGKYFCALAKLEANNCGVGKLRYFVVSNFGTKEVCAAIDFVAIPPTCGQCLAF